MKPRSIVWRRRSRQGCAPRFPRLHLDSYAAAGDFALRFSSRESVIAEFREVFIRSEQIVVGFPGHIVLNHFGRGVPVMREAHFVSTTIQLDYYRSGQLREQVPMRDGRRHGTARTWHKDGRLATEEPYQNGLLHGLCRQWDEAGRLLGRYTMIHGTGIQRAWHDNGQLQLEISTVRGEFSGRNRLWLCDGTLISERFYLN